VREEDGDRLEEYQSRHSELCAVRADQAHSSRADGQQGAAASAPEKDLQAGWPCGKPVSETVVSDEYFALWRCSMIDSSLRQTIAWFGRCSKKGRELRKRRALRAAPASFQSEHPSGFSRRSPVKLCSARKHNLYRPS
jgi:hypothetical protein